MLAAATAAALAAAGCGEHEGAGVIEGRALPADAVRARAASDDTAARVIATVGAVPAPAKQILFGDLHVHTTFSADAFLWSLPIMQGEGAHPVADACDFARYCSGLDFWSINDHAEALTPRRWRETKEAVRQCNAVAGDATNPDLVTFLGWEWSQMGRTPADHYGHKNVIFRDTEDDQVPRRPIHSASYAYGAMRRMPPLVQTLAVPMLDWSNRQRYFNLFLYRRELVDVPDCPDDVDTRDLPDDCVEGAATPEVLFRKLAEWGFESLVIPHGTTWGLYTPRGSSWDKQLAGTQHDAGRQRLIEVFSGHGNSEQYRSWRAADLDAEGNQSCPEPSGAYEPCCWRAGEIIRSRCEDPASAECEARVRDARQIFLEAGPRAGRLTVPGATLTEWGNCETCSDCYLSSMNYRPGGAVQYILALTGFEDPANPRRFHFGFLGSSDTHRARPGTGYKDIHRLYNTDSNGPRDAAWLGRIYRNTAREPAREAMPFHPETSELPAYQTLDFERQASFFMSGGLVAVHAEGRSREAIWAAFERREVYATSGDRILLWFDLLNGSDGVAAMGTKTAMNADPRFHVRAVGSREQLPGCPDVLLDGLSSQRLEALCHGECYNPGDRRRRITRIEVVRILPQAYAGEPVDGLITDPWKVIPCPTESAGCAVEFDDPDFASAGRSATYYVRAIQEPTPAINAGALRCDVDAQGHCIQVHPCYGDYRTPADDDCLTLNEERAWSSPIYLDPAGVQR